ncbi:heterokaryon incompatibility protein-domain-containing protein [Xylaria digitata]|nr:heterokaryon incompatibility protein-domain-containing protein [Xylaria digitata]
MAAAHADSDEMKCSLQSIRQNLLETSITTQLVEIQSAQIKQQKSLEFLSKLECLYFFDSRKRKFNSTNTEKPVLLRKRVNAFDELSGYVALSYTWAPSPSETSRQVGGYQVEQRRSSRFEPSPVRDNIFNRIRRYMEHTCITYFWIDQHGIQQEDGEDKEIGMHAMDRVYSLSKHPVALLAEPIIESELQFLVRILRGTLVHKSHMGFELFPSTQLNVASNAIRVLKKITSDTWFTRGWTFQENYRAGTRMMLLIPHAPALNKMKPREYLGCLDGELCINSVRFHEEATKLCLAYQSRQPPAADLCGRILSKAGRYSILLRNRDRSGQSSMTPTIVADLVNRELKTTWDRLPIAANCCQYSVRLNSTRLRKKGHSLSLSLLGLCLPNGEILSNQPQQKADVEAAQALSIADFLKTQSFNKLRSPHPRHSLTFTKGCRFVEVKLTEEGVQTKGHLWKTNCLVPTNSFPPGDWYPGNPRNALGLSEVWRLGHLANALRKCGEYDLSNQLRDLIDSEYDTNPCPTFSQEWQIRMAKLVAWAAH